MVIGFGLLGNFFIFKDHQSWSSSSTVVLLDEHSFFRKFNVGKEILNSVEIDFVWETSHNQRSILVIAVDARAESYTFSSRCKIILLSGSVEIWILGIGDHIEINKSGPNILLVELCCSTLSSSCIVEQNRSPSILPSVLSKLKLDWFLNWVELTEEFWDFFMPYLEWKASNFDGYLIIRRD